jgi:NtrC-family two-component system sensor histidine kinase KinB
MPQGGAEARVPLFCLLAGRRMLSLRKKFILGNLGLLAIIVMAASSGVTVARRTSTAVQKMFRANYDTVVACQHMSDDLKSLNLGLQLAMMKHLGGNRRAQDLLLSDFEKNLDFQQGNITEPGESEETAQLAKNWLAYKKSYGQLRGPGGSMARQEAVFEKELLPLTEAIDKNCREITALNLKNMSIVEGRASVLAKEAAQWGLSLLILATALAALGVDLLGRWVLNPIRALTESAKEIAAGNLDLAVSAPSQDEIGELAASFNQMAARLKELRQSDRAKLVKVQRSTQRALEALSDAVALLTPAGDVELANPAAQRLFDLKAGAPPGPQCPKDLVALLQACTRELRAFEPKAYGAALQVFDVGRERFFLPRVELVVDEGRHLLGLVLVLVDVTGLRQMDEMKSGLVSTVSHELKTPLTGLRMALYLLLDEKTGDLSHKQEELLIAARQDAERLHEILENLLDIGRLESGHGALNLVPSSSVKLALDALEPERPAFLSKGVRLEGDPSPEDFGVLADATRLKHVFTNLLENALRHTPSGGLVRLNTAKEGDWVRFSVSDSGEGIPEAYQGRLFEKFFRVPGQDSASGAGLGLAISKEIVEAHGGRIELKSRPGQGCTLSFFLKAA